MCDNLASKALVKTSKIAKTGISYQKGKSKEIASECTYKENWNLFVDMLRWQYDGETFKQQTFWKANKP